MKETVFTTMIVAGFMAAYAYLVGFSNGNSKKNYQEGTYREFRG